VSSGLHDRIARVIKRIPRGRVATYGQVAGLAGSPRAARQVVWVLNARSEKDRLPWHRVINSQGKIGLRPGDGYELQRALLVDEGLVFENDRVDLSRFQWRPRNSIV